MHAIHMHCDDKNQNSSQWSHHDRSTPLIWCDPPLKFHHHHHHSLVAHLENLLPFSMSSSEAFHMKETQLWVYLQEFERKF